MYIDTCTKDSMEISVCRYLNIAPSELIRLFKKVDDKINKQNDSQYFDKIVNDFLYSKIPQDNPIDQILFHHLSRRINSIPECNIINNLFTLLTTKNSLNDFLKEHNIKFIPCNGHLELWYQGEIMSLDNSYLKSRFGYYSLKIDYCINGFMLKDLIYKNQYTWNLRNAPEFINELSDYLHNTDLLDDYFGNSTYYCFTYKVPLKKIIFDNRSKLPDVDKPLYLMNLILYRLFEYYNTDDLHSDSSNPVIRLKDDDT